MVTVFAHLAATDTQARDVGAAALGRFLGALLEGDPPPNASEIDASMGERGTGLFGSVEQIRSSVSAYESIGTRHLALITRFGGMSLQTATQTLEGLAPARA